MLVQTLVDVVVLRLSLFESFFSISGPLSKSLLALLFARDGVVPGNEGFNDISAAELESREVLLVVDQLVQIAKELVIFVFVEEVARQFRHLLLV